MSTSPQAPEAHVEQNPNSEQEPPASRGHPTDGSTTPSTSAPTPVTPSLASRIWTKLGFSPMVFMIMLKPAVAATIAMAIFQKYAVAKNYFNFGYLIIVVSIITVPILPRGKFLMNLFATLFLTCFAAGMVLLGQWAGIKAREHTTPAGAPLSGYNSSASVINAIFLVVNIFGITVLRAARPVFGIPSIQYTVFIMVGFTYGPIQATVATSQRIVKELLYAFLTGQAISTGVSLFVIPVSSRKVFFAEATGYLQTCRKVLRAQVGFVSVLEHSSLCSPLAVHEAEKAGEDISEGRALFKQKAGALKAISDTLLELATKLREDVTFAKREIAVGHFRETDIHEFYELIVHITYPISGLSGIAEIAELMQECYPVDAVTASSSANSPSQAALDVEQQDWWDLIRSLTISFDGVITILDESILHILILLRIVPGAKKGKGTDANGDAEKGDSPPKAGDPGFGNYLEQQIKELRGIRTADVQKWAAERGLNSVFQSAAKNNMNSAGSKHATMDPAAIERGLFASKRLHVVFYMEYLLYSVSLAILDLVRFAEQKSQDSTFTRIRLVLPALKTLIKWGKGLIDGDEANNEENFDQLASNAPTVYLGDSFRRAKDPEHLPPKNQIQAWGDHLRAVPRALGSAPVAFGVRVTIAVMSIGILAYLEKTHEFFIKQRVVWCLVMVSFGMSPTTGSAVFSLFWSLVFTALGMVGAFINWYIADQKTPAVIVIFFLMLQIYFYFCARYPRFLLAIVAGALTHVLTIGYELQVRVIGLSIATATGQPYYPLYELAPYRLLTVAAGLVVAYTFTIFPVPITESSVFRRNLGNSVLLLAKYMSSVTATVDCRLAEKEGNTNLATSPGHRLAKIRKETLQKQVQLLNSMRMNLGFLSWEPRLGGDFPRETYQTLVEEVQRVTNYLTIIAYATESFPRSHAAAPWLSQFASSRSATDHEAHKVVSLFALLSSSILNGQPLPPYLKAPAHFRLSDELVGSKTNVLALENLNEPGFRAIAVIEVAQRCLVRSLDGIVECVKELVGEMDFSYRVEGGSGSGSGGGGGGGGSSSSVVVASGEGKQKIV